MKEEKTFFVLLQNDVISFFRGYIDCSGQFSWLYLLCSVLLAVWVYSEHRTQVSSHSSSSFLSYLFPKKIYTSFSAKQDYWLYLWNSIIGILISAWIAWMAFPIYEGPEKLAVWLEKNLGSSPFPLEDGFMTRLFFTTWIVLANDFAVFFCHYMFHKLPRLWHFHRVHHSAQVLTPITSNRTHPFDDILNYLYGIAALIVLGGLFRYLFGVQPQTIKIAGVEFWVFLFRVFGTHLRHSHIWFTFPRPFSYIFLSPAHHQLHHSRADEHIDKNFGAIFSFWDRLFGTHMMPPEEDPDLSFGLNKENPNPYHSVADTFIRPFRDFFRN
ncbi:MAG: sterol desaturase family protein [Spirochaetota bacterium]